MLIFKFQARFKKQGKTRQNTKVAQFCEKVSIYDLCLVNLVIFTALNNIFIENIFYCMLKLQMRSADRNKKLCMY